MPHEQLKRRPVPCSGTQNEPREKENEHTSTANTSNEGAHFNSGYGTAKSGIRLSRTHRTYARKRTKTDRVTAPRYPNRNNTDNRELQIENPQENAQNYGMCLAEIVYNTRTSSSPSAAAQAQQPPSHLEEQNHLPQKMHAQSCLASFFYNTWTCSNDDHAAPSPRSSPARAQQPGARPEVSIVNERRNRCKCHVSCQFSYVAQTCNDRYAAAPAHRLNDEMEGAEEVGPEQPARAVAKAS